MTSALPGQSSLAASLAREILPASLPRHSDVHLLDGGEHSQLFVVGGSRIFDVDGQTLRELQAAVGDQGEHAVSSLLAGLGLYGVTAYSVARRRIEIGIRMALGAPPSGVVWLVLARVAWLAGGGVIIGAGLSLWASVLVASLLYGLAPRDPANLIGAAVMLIAVAALAGWLPARRASRIAPAAMLREG